MEGAFARHGGDDLAAVEAAVFDEDFAGVHSAYHDARDVNSGDIAFEAFGIRLRFFRYWVEADSLLLEKFEVGMIAGHREHLSSGQGLLVRIRLHPDFAGLDARNFGVEHRGDFAGADAIFDVGLHPVFQALAQRRIAMNQRDVRAAAK